LPIPVDDAEPIVAAAAEQWCRADQVYRAIVQFLDEHV